MREERPVKTGQGSTAWRAQTGATAGAADNGRWSSYSLVDLLQLHQRYLWPVIILVAVILGLAVVAMTMATGAYWFLPGAGLFLLVTCGVMLMAQWFEVPLLRDLAVCALLVGEACVFAATLQRNPIHVEAGLCFPLVVTTIALMGDLRLLLAVTVMAEVAIVSGGLAMPGLLAPAEDHVLRAFVHFSIILGLAAIMAGVIGIVRVALAAARRSEERAQRAIAGLEQARTSLATELTTTSDQAQRLSSLLSAFRGETAGRLDRLNGASMSLATTATAVLDAADQAAAQTGIATSAAANADREVREVADAAEEFRAMIEEIARQASTSKELGAEAFERALATSSRIEELTTTSQKIETILGLIAGIANHTNLLALNATIEAARAGEQGRGFAVVAAEVKDLALQTTRAVADISSLLDLIRAGTGRSTEAVTMVAESIKSLSEIAAAIASGVDDRLVIAKSVAQSAQGTAQTVEVMRGAVGTMRRLVDETNGAARFLHAAAEEIAAETSAIRRDVDEFATDLAAH